MSIDFKDMYLGRIQQINIDINKAIRKKDWKNLAKLKAEKKELEILINQMK